MYTKEQQAFMDSMKDFTMKCIKSPGLTKKFMAHDDVDVNEMIERMISSVFFVDTVVCSVKANTATDDELSVLFVEVSKSLGHCDMMTATHFFLRGAIACLTNQYALQNKIEEVLN